MEAMIVVWALSWWYGAGWKARALLFRERMARTIDYFSIDILVRTLFAPFRQISAGKVNGPLEVRWRYFVDRLISRAIGAFMRTILIVVGCVWVVLQAVFGVVALVLWAFVPFLPIIGFIAAIAGWAPSWL